MGPTRRLRAPKLAGTLSQSDESLALSRALKKLGFSYQKARFISDRQEEETYQIARKKWLEETLPAIIKKAEAENSVVLFGDEVSFAMWGSLARTWAPIGQATDG